MVSSLLRTRDFLLRVTIFPQARRTVARRASQSHQSVCIYTHCCLGRHNTRTHHNHHHLHMIKLDRIVASETRITHARVLTAMREGAIHAFYRQKAKTIHFKKIDHFEQR